VLLLSEYDLQINARTNGNVLRFARRSCKPVAETRAVFVDGMLRVGIYAKQPISSGAEITIPFEYDPLKSSHIIDCGCEDKDSCEMYACCYVTTEHLQCETQP